VPTAATARDRLLLALKRHHPQHFRGGLCARVLAPRGGDQGRASQAGPVPLRRSVQHRCGRGLEGTRAR
jgi:hypothetical protein